MRKLWIWILILVVGNIIWLTLDKYPPAWDQAAHLRSVILTNQWLRGRFWGNMVDLIRSFGGYPPLVYFLGGVWSLVSGLGVNQIGLLNTLFLVVATVGVYKLAGGKLLPAILFSLFPVIYDISRNMLLDLALMAWVVWGLYFWLQKKDLGVLVMLILASLTKLNGFIYFLPIIASYWRQPKKILLYGLVYGVTVAWWWGLNWQNIYQYLTGLAGQGEKLTDPMNLGDWRTWIHYFRLFFLQQIGPVTAIIFLVFGKKENKKLIWWLVVTYAIFTVIKNKDFRFTMPLLSVVAVWFGWGLEEQTHPPFGHPPLTRRVKHLMTALLLLWMGFNYVENSYNWPFRKPVVVSTPTFLFGDINWINFSDYPVREVRNQVWPQKEIVADLEKYSIAENRKLNLLVLMNREELNDNNLGMYKELWGSQAYETGSVGSVTRFENEGQIMDLLRNFQVILMPGQDFDPAPFYGINLEAYKQVRDYVWGNEDRFEWMGEYQMPKYGKVYLVRSR